MPKSLLSYASCAFLTALMLLNANVNAQDKPSEDKKTKDSQKSELLEIDGYLQSYRTDPIDLRIEGSSVTEQTLNASVLTISFNDTKLIDAAIMINTFTGKGGIAVEVLQNGRIEKLPINLDLNSVAIGSILQEICFNLKVDYLIHGKRVIFYEPIARPSLIGSYYKIYPIKDIEEIVMKKQEDKSPESILKLIKDVIANSHPLHTKHMTVEYIESLSYVKVFTDTDCHLNIEAKLNSLRKQGQ